jgi:hypothetical protein
VGTPLDLNQHEFRITGLQAMDGANGDKGSGTGGRKDFCVFHGHNTRTRHHHPVLRAMLMLLET